MSRTRSYVVLLLVIAGVVAAAFYQEDLTYFFQLRGWDKAAPGRAVSEFLTAGKKGDQQVADGYLGTDTFKPLSKDGRWIGYSQPGIPGTTIDYVFADLAPEGEPKVNKTEFVYAGNGAAMVSVPDRTGRPVDYRLEIRGAGWKITEIRGGKPHF